MNITITGSLGNIGNRLTQQLVKEGHTVTVISHTPGRRQAIEQLQAIPAIGSINDIVFLTNAFTNADAVFMMIPPNPAAIDAPAYIKKTGEGYAHAIQQAGIGYVVNLSSIGAHNPNGLGPTGANNHTERQLNALQHTKVLHLRPGMFYNNFFGAIPSIKQHGFMGSNFGPDVNIVLSHPRDIADAAANALHDLSYTHGDVRYIAGAETTGSEIASILGKAIEMPQLQWVEMSDEQLLQGLMQNGFTENMAMTYIVEIGMALRNGTLLHDFAKHHHAPDNTNLAAFAAEFAAVYLAF